MSLSRLIAAEVLDFTLSIRGLCEFVSTCVLSVIPVLHTTSEIAMNLLDIEWSCPLLHSHEVRRVRSYAVLSTLVAMIAHAGEADQAVATAWRSLLWVDGSSQFLTFFARWDVLLVCEKTSTIWISWIPIPRRLSYVRRRMPCKSPFPSQLLCPPARCSFLCSSEKRTWLRHVHDNLILQWVGSGASQHSIWW